MLHPAHLLTALGLICAPAAAQLVYALDVSPGVENHFLDEGSGAQQSGLWSAVAPVGLGDDDVNGVLYMTDGGGLHAWPYLSSAPPTAIGAVTDSTGAAFTPFGLAYDGGVLYGWRSGAVGVEGFYSIDVVTGQATLAYAMNVDTGDHGGLDIDPATGLFYTSNDLATYTDSVGGWGRGIVEIDTATSSEVIVTPYPPGITDVDGLAFDPAGRVVLIEDEPAPLHAFDLAGMIYDPLPPMNAVQATGVWSAGTWSVGLLPSGSSIGASFCGPAILNTAGSSGTIAASGSPLVAQGDVRLIAADLPPNQFGIFLNARSMSFVPMPGGSQGTLCLGGAIGRYNAPGQVLNSGSVGAIALQLDLSATPTPTGPVAIAAGETWFFQCWYRDLLPSGPTSNFTDGLQIDFQ